MECAALEFFVENECQNNTQHDTDPDDSDGPDGSIEYDTAKNLLTEQVLEVFKCAELLKKVGRRNFAERHAEDFQHGHQNEQDQKDQAGSQP